MNSVTIFLIAASGIFGGVLLGVWLQRLLPVHHLGKDSHEIVKLGAGMIATLTALVLGLMVSSAKNSFDTMNAAITQSGAKIILLDRVLANYGLETKGTREHLRQSVAAGVDMFWPEEKNAAPGLVAFERAHSMEEIQDQLRALTPQTDAQRQLLS